MPLCSLKSCPLAFLLSLAQSGQRWGRQHLRVCRSCPGRAWEVSARVLGCSKHTSPCI